MKPKISFPLFLLAWVLGSLIGLPAAAQGPPEPPKLTEEEKWAREQWWFAEQTKKLLQVGDAEWEVLGPKIGHVVSLKNQAGLECRIPKLFGQLPKAPKPPKPGQDPNAPDQGKPKDKQNQQNNPDRQSVAGLPPIPPPPDPPRELRPRTELTDAARALLTGLADDDTTPEVLRAKLAEFHATRARVLTELNKSQQELRDLLTLRQEVALTVMGVLD
jgi:hypothetical protein